MDDGAADIDLDVATAVGLLAITDMAVPEAAATADVSTWELEDAVESNGLVEALGIDNDADLTSQIDEMLDGNS